MTQSGREYDSLDALRADLAKFMGDPNARSTIYDCPPGTGKTYAFAHHFVPATLESGRKVMYLTNKLKNVYEVREMLGEELGIIAGVITGRSSSLCKQADKIAWCGDNGFSATRMVCEGDGEGVICQYKDNCRYLEMLEQLETMDVILTTHQTGRALMAQLDRDNKNDDWRVVIDEDFMSLLSPAGIEFKLVNEMYKDLGAFTSIGVSVPRRVHDALAKKQKNRKSVAKGGGIGAALCVNHTKMYARNNSLMCFTVTELLKGNKAAWLDLQDAIHFPSLLKKAGCLTDAYKPDAAELYRKGISMHAVYGAWRMPEKDGKMAAIFINSKSESKMLVEPESSVDIYKRFNITILDGTCMMDEIEYKMAKKFIHREFSIDREWKALVHIDFRGCGKQSTDNNLDKKGWLEERFNPALEYVPEGAKVLLVTYKGNKSKASAKEDLGYIEYTMRNKLRWLRPDLIVEVGHYGGMSGLNEYEKQRFDVVIAFGAPRLKPGDAELAAIIAGYKDEDKQSYHAHRKMCGQMIQCVDRLRPLNYPGQKICIFIGKVWPFENEQPFAEIKPQSWTVGEICEQIMEEKIRHVTKKAVVELTQEDLSKKRWRLVSDKLQKNGYRKVKQGRENVLVCG